MSLTVDSTLGAAFIGFGFSCLGYGFVLSQIVSYFTRYTADKAVYKFLVSDSLAGIFLALHLVAL